MQRFQIVFQKREGGSEKDKAPLPIDAPGGRTRVYLNRQGLIPVVVQNSRTREVLRLGYMDAWALELSVKNRILFLYKRSRQRVVKVGEKEDREYPIREMWLDRNKRAILVLVEVAEMDTSQCTFKKRLLAGEVNATNPGGK